MIQSLSNFADQGLILPIMVLAALALAAMGWHRAALAWIIVVPATLGTLLTAKLFVASCGWQFPTEWNFHSPSGHTASAAVVYGGFTALLTPGRRTVPRAALYAIAAGVLIGLTRIQLGAHTLGEVIVGGLIGTAGAITLAAIAQSRPETLKRWPILVGLLIFAIALLHGSRVDAETWIADAANAFWPFTLCRP